MKGTGEPVPALLGGHVGMAFSAYPWLSGAIETNKVTLLATNGAKRSPQAPDAPPVADCIPGFDFAPIIGFLARRGTPEPIVTQIAAEAIETIKDPEIMRALNVVGWARRIMRGRFMTRPRASPKWCGSPASSRSEKLFTSCRRDRRAVG